MHFFFRCKDGVFMLQQNFMRCTFHLRKDYVCISDLRNQKNTSYLLFLPNYIRYNHSFPIFVQTKINKIMYPLKFKPILKSTLWGGERIIPFKQLDYQQEQVGESWEISDVPGDESVVAEGADAGKNLTQLMEEYKGKLVGEENYKRFQGKFPLLIKFIDAKQDLSIQVHPDDELAMKRHQSMGKTEMWYIIDNTGGQAHLYSGLKNRLLRRNMPT